MVNLLKTSGRLAGALLAAGLAAWAQGAPQGGMAQPGALNYTEGLVYLNGQAVHGSQSAQVAPGQVLETRDGRAEMLLTPGVFLRLDNNSKVKMDSASIMDTRVQLLKGEAMVEAAELEKENNLQIADAGINTRIDKRGIYQFNANQPMVAVYDGGATVRVGDRDVNVKKGHELALTGVTKAQKFDTHNTDPLYSWSKLRSEYMAQANMATAQTIVVNNPGWFYGTGWYWNPYFDSWAFVPGGGYFNSPFGFGFYSPAYWSYYTPLYRGYPYVRRGVGIGRGTVAAPNLARPAFRGVPAARPAPAFRGGFHGGAGMHIGRGR